MKKPEQRPETLCLAPWTHTYLNPQVERRMCCASREPAQNFKQYIDTSNGTGKFIPLTLEEHWNSPHMRNVRVRMMNGESLPECQVCDTKILNTDVYRSYFSRLFDHKYDEVWETTSADGTTTMKPVSWDYRFTNLCNFKCRMCGDMLSSAWESEQRQHNTINWSNPGNMWMMPDIRQQISKFQDEQIEREFSEAVEEHRVEEIYWVGGEPLMYEQHWRYMKRIIELGDGPRVYARYNTNLSRIEYGGTNLFSDILKNIRDWQVCASLDGTGDIGEYIRTGLKYDEFVNNFKEGMKHASNPRQMRLDFTLTLPGLFEISNIEALAKELNTSILAKVTFAFGPDIVMSPLALPRHILNRKIKELTPTSSPALNAVLVQLLNRPNFEEEFPDTYKQGLEKGKARILQLESIRDAKVTMADILSQDKEIYDWWQAIN